MVGVKSRSARCKWSTAELQILCGYLDKYPNATPAEVKDNAFDDSVKTRVQISTKMGGLKKKSEKNPKRQRRSGKKDKGDNKESSDLDEDEVTVKKIAKKDTDDESDDNEELEDPIQELRDAKLTGKNTSKPVEMGFTLNPGKLQKALAEIDKAKLDGEFIVVESDEWTYCLWIRSFSGIIDYSFQVDKEERRLYVKRIYEIDLGIACKELEEDELSKLSSIQPTNTYIAIPQHWDLHTIIGVKTSSYHGVKFCRNENRFQKIVFVKK
jgi:hypothetical protein